MASPKPTIVVQKRLPRMIGDQRSRTGPAPEIDARRAARRTRDTSKTGSQLPDEQQRTEDIQGAQRSSAALAGRHRRLPACGRADVLAQLVHDVGERVVVGDLEVARPRQVDLAPRDDPPGALAHHVDGVGEEHRLAQVVRHQHHREALLPPQVAQHAPQLLARERVERAERLVEHQQLRLVDQRAADRRALLHAAGQLPRELVLVAVQPDGLQQRARQSAYFARSR